MSKLNNLFKKNYDKCYLFGVSLYEEIFDKKNKYYKVNYSYNIYQSDNQIIKIKENVFQGFIFENIIDAIDREVNLLEFKYLDFLFEDKIIEKLNRETKCIKRFVKNYNFVVNNKKYKFHFVLFYYFDNQLKYRIKNLKKEEINSLYYDIQKRLVNKNFNQIKKYSNVYVFIIDMKRPFKENGIRNINLAQIYNDSDIKITKRIIFDIANILKKYDFYIINHIGDGFVFICKNVFFNTLDLEKNKEIINNIYCDINNYINNVKIYLNGLYDKMKSYKLRGILALCNELYEFDAEFDSSKKYFFSFYLDLIFDNFNNKIIKKFEKTEYKANFYFYFLETNPPHLFIKYFKNNEFLPMKIKRVIFIELVRGCNSKCKYCCEHQYEKKFMSKTQMRYIIAFIKNSKNYEFEIYITGGEPLLHDKLCDFVDSLKELTNVKKIILYTNGILLNKIDCKKKFDKIIISIDGYDKNTYIVTRGIDKFDEVSKNLKSLIYENVDVLLKITLFPEYISYVNRFIEFANNIGIERKQIKFGILSRNFCKKCNCNDNDFDKIMNDYIKNIHNDNFIKTYFNDIEYLNPYSTPIKCDFKSEKIIIITYEGYIKKCFFQEKINKNFKIKNFLNIEEYENKMDDKLHDLPCKYCKCAIEIDDFLIKRPKYEY
ncbi:radical SAM protein [Caminibacter pacificus]